MSLKSGPGDDDDDGPSQGSGRKMYKEFDCPVCSANNPVDPPFTDADELLCNYCGAQFVVKLTDDGRVKLKET
jgi:transcription elongation factor Elf1